MINNQAKQSRLSGIYFIIALGLISVLAFTFLFCISGFFLGIKISWWQFPLACVTSLIVAYFAGRSLAGHGIQASFIKNAIAIIVLTGASVGLAGYFYDISFDGQWYHQENIYRLKQGYNPVYQSLVIPPDESGNGAGSWCAPDPKSPAAQAANKPFVNMKYLALNYFCKGAEITSADIYGCTNRIETGKAVNVLLLLASFFLCLSVFYRVDKIKKPFVKWLLAIIFAFNPITCNELFSYCVDGYGGSALVCLLAVFALIMLWYNRWSLYMLFAVIIITVNVKSTMLAFTVVLCAGFLLVLVIQKSQRYLIRPVIVTSLVAGSIGVFVFGFNPYVTTYIRQHNVFYGLTNVKDEIERLTPVALRGHNRFVKLVYSVSAHVGWPDDSKKTFSSIAKVPFAFNKNDIVEADDIEEGVSGFGPFYSGALLVALVAFAIAAFDNAKTNAFRVTGIALAFLFTTVMIVPDNWWTRFVPQLWLLPAVVLLMLSFISFKGSGFLKGILTIAMALSVFWGSLVFVANLLNNARTNHLFAQMKALNKPVYIDYCDYRNFKSNGIRLTEAGIPLSTKPIMGDNEVDMPSSTTHIQLPGPLPKVPESFLFKLRSKLAPSSNNK